MVGVRRTRDPSFRSGCNKESLIYLPRLAGYINIQPLLLITRKKRRDLYFLFTVGMLFDTLRAQRAHDVT